MAGYWLKLYTEILNDRKYFNLSDQAKLGMYELFLVAKITGDDGSLPSIDDIVFQTRREASWWNAVLEELTIAGIIVGDSASRTVKNFSSRQAAITGSERAKASREIRNKNGNAIPQIACETQQSACETHANPCESNGERKKEKEIQKETEREKENAPRISSTDLSFWNKALGKLRSDISGADYASYVQNLELEEVNNNTFVARVANEYAANLIRVRYGPDLTRHLSGISGRSCEIQIVT